MAVPLGSLSPALSSSRCVQKPRIVPSIHRTFCPQSINLSPDIGRGPLTGTKGLEFRVKREVRKASWLGKSFPLGDLYPSDPSPKLRSPSDVATHFYTSINDKNLNKLDSQFSKDCVFEDLAFPEPFRGVKEVKSFLKDLTAAMGENVKFVLESVYEGNESTAAVIWHLEWSGKILPFTRGCSFFKCQTSGDGLVIKDALIVVESPFKPGKLAMDLLKVIHSMFDRFPDLANRFLQKPDALIQFVMRMYKIFIEPFILPVLIYYSHVWTLIANVLKQLLNLLQKFLQIFM